MNDNKPQGNSEWVEELGIDKYTVACDGIGCNEKATWFSTFRCCNGTILSCEMCLVGAYRTMLKLSQSQKIISCKACGERSPAQGWLQPPQEL